MIRKLYNKLLLLFLTFTMLTFTAAMLLMISNTVVEVRHSEVEYISNIADSLIEEIKSKKDIEDLNLMIYAAKSQCWVGITDGTKTQTTPENLETSSTVLCEQIYAGNNILSETGTINESNAKESNRTVYSLTGIKKEKYYGVQTKFNAENKSYDLIVIYPATALWNVLRSYCKLYPLLWVTVFGLMYLISRFLIKKAVSPIEATLKSQKEFIASASHELKSPLAVIQVNAETLDLEKPNQNSLQKQKIILEECERMSSLIKSLLALAASDAGNWKMNMREIDVDTLLIETWEMFVESARKKSIRINLNINETYPKIICDRERITQVLGILLDNAIAYSNSDTHIEIGAQVRTKQIIFYVTDHGCGIPDIEKEKVFERFYSCDPSRTKKNHYGLGLSVAQEIVKLHHGTINLKDTLNGGCTFEISLPLDKSF